MSDAIETMSLEDIEKEISTLFEAMTAIKLQLGIARSESKIHGDYSDYEWFNKTRFALSKKTARHQKLVQEVAIRKRKARIDRGESEDRCFIDAAKMILDDDTFNEILAQAKVLKQERMKGPS